MKISQLNQSTKKLIKFKVAKILNLRYLDLMRLERVFRCYRVCETMEDYKIGYLMVWTNYMSPCSSIVGLYFKGICDVISVTMATHKIHKSVLYISVSVNYLKN